MTWIKFIIWLLGIYSIYYVAIIFWDKLRNHGAKTGTEKHELTFVEDINPIKTLVDDLISSGFESSFALSGGVSLKELFNLAREESVEYIKSVSF